MGAAVVLAGITLYLSGIGPHELGQLVNPDQGASSSAQSGAGSPESSEAVRVATSRDAEWAERGRPSADGRVSLGGTLSLNRGLAELVFAAGTRVILEGPATLDGVSGQGARLSKGQLTARVPREAVGFVIDTPDARIVDLGTEFSVAVEEDKWTEVEVVSGSVEVSPRAREAPSRTLLRGDAVRISRLVTGGQPQVVDISFGSRDYVREIGPR